jgi:hypothetical protein
LEAIVKTCHARRNVDSTHKKQVLDTTKLISDIMMKHLEFKEADIADISSSKKSAETVGNVSLYLTYYTIIFGLFSTLLTDGMSKSMITRHLTDVLQIARRRWPSTLWKCGRSIRLVALRLS